MKIIFVRESLESQGPRDLPSMKERTISYKMHGSRAPYDQMAPQLCQFYVPGQPCVMCRYGKLVLCVGTVSLSCVGTVSLSCVGTVSLCCAVSYTHLTLPTK